MTTQNEDFLVLKNVTKSFGKSVVIDNLNLRIKRGTMTTLLGPSGCGKTTILRLVAGLESPTSGQIFIDGEDVTKSSIQNRDICIVFQSYALFPHMSIADNVGYGLKMLNVSSKERKQRIEEALARALVLKPKVLLFDEPLSNLDANLRRAMREKIRELQQQLNITSLYVTHDQTEAFAVSDEVIVMHKGHIMQKASAKELYLRPNSLFLANFMGESTIYPATLHDGRVAVNDYEFDFPDYASFAVKDGECMLGIRPEAVFLTSEGSEAQRCEIKSAVYMGNHWEVIALWQGQELLVNTRPEDFQADQRVAYVKLSLRGVFLLPCE